MNMAEKLRKTCCD